MNAPFYFKCFITFSKILLNAWLYYVQLWNARILFPFYFHFFKFQSDSLNLKPIYSFHLFHLFGHRYSLFYFLLITFWFRSLFEKILGFYFIASSYFVIPSNLCFLFNYFSTNWKLKLYFYVKPESTFLSNISVDLSKVIVNKSKHLKLILFTNLTEWIHWHKYTN